MALPPKQSRFNKGNKIVIASLTRRSNPVRSLFVITSPTGRGNPVPPFTSLRVWRQTKQSSTTIKPYNRFWIASFARRTRNDVRGTCWIASSCRTRNDEREGDCFARIPRSRNDERRRACLRLIIRQNKKFIHIIHKGRNFT